MQLVRTIAGRASGVTPDVTWLGLCLPSRELLVKWRHQHRKWPARKLWGQALARGGYEAVVFMRTWQGAYVRFCETEAMQMKQTDLHPQYAEYQKSVVTEMAKPRVNGQR